MAKISKGLVERPRGRPKKVKDENPDPHFIKRAGDGPGRTEKAKPALIHQ